MSNVTFLCYISHFCFAGPNWSSPKLSPEHDDKLQLRTCRSVFHPVGKEGYLSAAIFTERHTRQSEHKEQGEKTNKLFALLVFFYFWPAQGCLNWMSLAGQATTSSATSRSTSRSCSRTWQIRTTASLRIRPPSSTALPPPPSTPCRSPPSPARVGPR